MSPITRSQILGVPKVSNQEHGSSEEGKYEDSPFAPPDCDGFKLYTSSPGSSSTSNRKRKRSVCDGSSEAEEERDEVELDDSLGVQVREQEWRCDDEVDDVVDYKDEHDCFHDEAADTAAGGPMEDEMSEDGDEYDQYLALLSKDSEDTGEALPAGTAYEIFAAEQWSVVAQARPDLNYMQLNICLNEIWAALMPEEKACYQQIALLQARPPNDIEMSEVSEDDAANNCKVCGPCLVINAEVDRIYDLLSFIRDRAEFDWMIGKRWQSLDRIIRTLELVPQGMLDGGDSDYHDYTACNHLGGAWACLETGIEEVKMHLANLQVRRNRGKKRIPPETMMQLFESHLW